MRKPVPTFAEVKWTAHDVRRLKAGKKMTISQAEEWLCINESRIQDRICELGFEVIESLLGE